MGERGLFCWSAFNNPKFLGQTGLAKQCRRRSEYSLRSGLIRVYTVCHSVCIFCTHYSIVNLCCFHFRIITAVFRVSYLFIFRAFKFGGRRYRALFWLLSKVSLDVSLVMKIKRATKTSQRKTSIWKFPSGMKQNSSK